MRMNRLPGMSRDVSRVALGTAWYGTDIPEDRAFAIMDAYVEHGGNFLDTAHMYASWVTDGAGKSETTIGKWVRSRRPGGVVIATKGADKGMNRATIRQQLDESLDRLGMASVDFYWLHRDDPDVPVADILGWLNELREEGRFEAFGCSNWRRPRIQEAIDHAKQAGVRGFSGSQISWSLARAIREEVAKLGQVFMDDDMFAFHQKTGLPCVAYSSQAGGFFAGKYDPVSPTPNTEPNANIVRIFGSDQNYARLEAAKAIAAERGVSANQIAVAYLTSVSFPGYAIAGPNSVEQVVDSVGGGAIELTPDEVRRLEV